MRPAGALAAALVLLAPGALDAAPRPVPRPPAPVPEAVRPEVRHVLRPAPRPDDLAGSQGARGKAAPRRAMSRGALCGDPALRGRPRPRMAGRLDGCGIAHPVRLRSVAGVALSRPATLDCRTARALSRWVRGGLKPVVGGRGGGPASLRVVASYACRPVNNQPGNDISEHGRGRAIDIAGVRLRDGTRLRVRRDWGHGRAGRILRRLQRAACGIFGTVLGPEANRYHGDHFHFDTAHYAGGAYCR